MAARRSLARHEVAQALDHEAIGLFGADGHAQCVRDRKSTRLNSSHSQISYAVFCLKKKTTLCYVVGGLVDHFFGWRSAFFVAGVSGLLLAALALRLYDPPRGAQDPDEIPGVGAHGRPPGGLGRAAYTALLRNRPYVLTVLGYAAYTFAIGALGSWNPAFLERTRGMSQAL